MICNDVADIYQLLDEAEYNMKSFADVEGVAGASSDIYISLYIIRKRNQVIVCVFLKINFLNLKIWLSRSL